MNTILTIIKRELKSYFSTPIALIFLVVFLILCGVFTFKLGGFYDQGEAELRSFFMWHPWLYLFIIPAISMRLWAEEKRVGTIELLLTLPIKVEHAVIGKFIAAWLFIGFALALTCPLVYTVNFLGDPDNGVILASYFGSFLMAGAYLAIGLALSATTKNQVIAFVLTTTLCLFLIILGHEPVVDTLNRALPSKLVDQLVNLSFPYHFEAIQRGVIDVRDFIYFIILISVNLVLSTVIVNNGKAE